MEGMAETPDSDFDIIVAEGQKVGIYANAFRIVEEAPPDVFLDFLAYSAQEKRAEVVSRVRIRRVFMDAVRESLGQAMRDFGAGEDEHLVVGEMPN